MALTEREELFWQKLSGAAGERGVPKAVCQTITPFPFWGVIAAIVIFIPIALVLSFFVSRQAIVVQGGEIVIYEVGIWTARVRGEPLVVPFGAGAISRDGRKLQIGEVVYQLQPGWEEPADRLIELSAAG